MSRSVCFTGGGTGGHVFPGIAVIGRLKARLDCEVTWIGSKTGMEGDIVSGYGIRFYGIPCGKLRRYISLKNFIDMFKVLAGFFASLALLAKARPALVFSKGGYVSVPVVAAAGFLRIPVFTHESDFDPGIATRINSVFAEKILTSFPQTSGFFTGKKRLKVVCTGNPIRPSLLAGDREMGRAYVGAASGKKILLVLGGSLGALAINEAIREILDELLAFCHVVHQTGKKDFREVTKPGYFCRPFFNEELADILVSASLAVCRAGSNTLWELAALGIPSILVPLSRSGSRGDQIRNAGIFEAEGASLVVEEDGLLGKRLLEKISWIIDNEDVLISMRKKAFALSRIDSADQIAALLSNRILRL